MIQRLHDPIEQRKIVYGRLALVAGLMVVMLSILVLRYHYLQIDQNERYSTLSDENRVHIRSVPPVRGLIFDRNGVILAENRPSYRLAVVLERTQNLPKLLADLQPLLELTDAELERFHSQLKKTRRPYEGVPLRFQLSEQDVAKLAANEIFLPGIEVGVELLRHYPLGDRFAHSVGYVGRINTRDQEKIDAARYEGIDVIGKVGIEKQYEDRLLGEVGYEYVETDARGNVLRVLDKENAVPGEDLYLHLDADLQTLLYDLLEGRRASVVALDVDTGGVLALASMPSYDPNLFVTGISYGDYNRLLNSRDRPLYDRALLGQYPPGSTLKPLFGLAGLVSGAVTEDWQIKDSGEFQLKNQERKYRDWKKGGHGTVDLRVAIEQSCDIYFYELGHRAGIDVLSRFGHYFGLGHKTRIDMPSERAGIMPSRVWKRGARGIAWYPGDTINTSIGQGFTLTTPIQLAQMTAMLARKGEYKRPRLLIETADDEIVEPLAMSDEEQPLLITEEQWQAVHSAMVDVVHSPYGTASRQGRLTKNKIAGKTGTAQVVGIAQDAEYDAELLEEYQRDHALFVAFAPAEQPKIAVAVVVENGEHGSSTAAPIARELIDLWLNKTANQGGDIAAHQEGVDAD